MRITNGGMLNHDNNNDDININNAIIDNSDDDNDNDINDNNNNNNNNDNDNDNIFLIFGCLYMITLYDNANFILASQIQSEMKLKFSFQTEYLTWCVYLIRLKSRQKWNSLNHSSAKSFHWMTFDLDLYRTQLYLGEFQRTPYLTKQKPLKEMLNLHPAFTISIKFPSHMLFFNVSKDSREVRTASLCL